MKAIILAAGRGSRMRELTDDRPKCLVEFRGRALLDRQIEAVQGAGFALNDIGIVTGYRRELLATRGLHEFHNARWAETNMVSSLESAGEWLASEPCVISYSDIFYAPSAVKALRDSDAPLAITYDRNWLALWQRRFGDPLLDAETFRLDAQHHLVEIGNKPQRVEDIQGQYMGLLRFTPVAWVEVLRLRAAMTAAERDNMHMTGTLQKVIAAGRVPVTALPYDGAWGEIDAPEDIAAYSDDSGAETPNGAQP